ncbi:MAG: RNA 2',3'-cyclic phosphodiesterase [Candidatus Sumerlaeia bacterium]|nr:RNA 2',3'-cyclic phosphodiesterase [Candidatus Sumerlaeia bacterium]
MNEAIRCFLAVEVSESVRNAAARLAGNLRKGIQFTKAHPAWVKMENQHFTVVFLGNQTPQQVERIQTALSDLPQRMAPFEVEVAGLGVFPNERSPRVLWVGVRRGREAFAALYEKVISRLVPLGFQPESRPFHPHLTLARIKSFRGAAEMMDIVRSHKDCSCGSFSATGLTLFRSQLHPDGAIYTVLAHWPFSAPSAP